MDGLPNQRLRRTSGWTSRRPDRALALALSGVALAPGVASAQALSCAIPNAVPVPSPAGPSASEPVRTLPTGGYTLAISWSPEYCRGKERDGSFQCGSSSRFGFVLHGLWPDGQGRQWPQYCAPVAILPPRIVKDMLCATPSADLIQHEWAKHGACGWTDPAAYFGTARKYYDGLRFPDMMALSRRRDLTVGAFRAEFARANAGLRGFSAGAIRVTHKNGWLSELWLCMDRRMAYVRCRASQDGGESSNAPLKIWRGALNDR